MRAVPREGVGLLLVEDEPDVRLALARGLESAGFDVVAAADADEALALWREESGIEFVLSDVVLRGSRSGSQMLAEMRRETPGLDCLLMTGYADSELDVAAAEIADVEVITKPFPMKALVQRIHARLAKAPVGTIAEVS
jgi:DNA-binding NtrC family response regulator